MVDKLNSFIYDISRIEAKVIKPLVFPFTELIKTELAEHDRNSAVLKIKYQEEKEEDNITLKVPLSQLKMCSTDIGTDCYMLLPGAYSVEVLKKAKEISITEIPARENINFILTGVDGTIILEDKYQITNICKIVSRTGDFAKILLSNPQWKKGLPAAAETYWSLAAVPENVKIVPTEYSPPNCVILHDLNNNRTLLLILSKSMRIRGIEPEKWYEISGKEFGVNKEIIKYFQIKSLVITEEWWGAASSGTALLSYPQRRRSGTSKIYK